MGFKRIEGILKYPTGQTLDKQLAGIGFKISSAKIFNPNIEDTIIAAAIEGLDGDFRTLSLLTDWFEVHSARVNVDRLERALRNLKNVRVRAYFSALAVWLSADSRFKKIKSIYQGPQILLGLTKSYEYLVSKNGLDERFSQSALIVARETLRRRIEDIDSPESLAKYHRDYYYRILIGPSYRADMVSLFERSQNISASDLAKGTYGSFATAWSVMKDLSILRT